MHKAKAQKSPLISIIICAVIAVAITGAGLWYGFVVRRNPVLEITEAIVLETNGTGSAELTVSNWNYWSMTIDSVSARVYSQTDEHFSRPDSILAAKAVEKEKAESKGDGSSRNIVVDCKKRSSKHSIDLQLEPMLNENYLKSFTAAHADAKKVDVAVTVRFTVRGKSNVLFHTMKCDLSVKQKEVKVGAQSDDPKKKDNEKKN